MPATPLAARALQDGLLPPSRNWSGLLPTSAYAKATEEPQVAAAAIGALNAGHAHRGSAWIVCRPDPAGGVVTVRLAALALMMATLLGAAGCSVWGPEGRWSG